MYNKIRTHVPNSLYTLHLKGGKFMVDTKSLQNSMKAELEKKFVSYISTLLHFNSINFDKKIRKHQDRFALIMDDVEESDLNHTNDELFKHELYGLENQISDPNLHKLFLKLSHREKKILNLSYGREERDIEIAQKLGVSQQSVSKSKKNALNKLRKFLYSEKS